MKLFRSAVVLSMGAMVMFATPFDSLKDDTAFKLPYKLKDRPLTLVKQVRPQYPDAARKDSLAGLVEIEATVDEEGSVEAVRTLAGNPILAEAAASAIRRFVYQAAVVDGKTIKSTTVVKLNFKASEARQ